MNGNATVWFVTIFEILRCPYSWALIEDFRALLEHKISCSSFLSLHSSPSSSKLLSMASYGGNWKGGLVSDLEEFGSRSKGPTTLRAIGLRITPN
ncbi:Protein FAM91A1 isoform F [Glycine soja]|uniref:Protein FAM91A1 isoform E n=1 Tax=Glycine soja TaxID=3848 RepID=A0A445F191_GLYSO|nr:Protein FAM91A1 isoform E [Glycine soja]RZB42556.1 Protein FAM91A1 isoform F [Glycine soja]